LGAGLLGGLSVHASEGAPEQAAIPERELRRDRPENPEHAFLMREAYEAIGRNELQGAIRVLREILRDTPRDKSARFALATVLIKMQRYREAIRILEPMTQEFPEDYTIFNNLAWIYAASSDVTVRDGNRAVELARKSLLMQPNDYHVWNTLSEAYYISGDYERAHRASQQALIMANRFNAPRERIQEYREQAEKCRRAHQAMSILE